MRLSTWKTLRKEDRSVGQLCLINRVIGRVKYWEPSYATTNVMRISHGTDSRKAGKATC